MGTIGTGLSAVGTATQTNEILQTIRNERTSRKTIKTS